MFTVTPLHSQYGLFVVFRFDSTWKTNKTSVPDLYCPVSVAMAFCYITAHAQYIRVLHTHQRSNFADNCVARLSCVK